MLKKIRGSIRHNPIYKFRGFWNSLELQEKRDMWSILTALRGQDKDGKTSVKRQTTGRIRKELFMDHEMDLPLLVIAPPLDLSSDIEDIQEAYDKTPFHFRHHIQCAVEALTKYVFRKRVNDIRKIINLNRD